jgi:hypothetical protein
MDAWCVALDGAMVVKGRLLEYAVRLSNLPVCGGVLAVVRLVRYI